MNADDTLVSTTTAATTAFPRLGELAGDTRRRLVRRIRYAAIDQIKAGVTEPAAIRAAVLAKLEAGSDFGSILAILGVAVLTALVEWIVKRLLDRWAKEGDFLA